MNNLNLVQLKKDNFYTKNTLLRKESNEVTDFGDEFQKFIEDLIFTFKNHKIAVGLAAPQVGINLKVTIINPTRHEKIDNTLILVNPKIISSSGKKKTKKEACMSLPHFQGEVERREKIKITYQDRYGEHHILEEKGFFARVLFHEIDHLEGVLYIDRMNHKKLESVDFFEKD